MKKSKFYMMPAWLLCSNGYFSPNTGEVVKFSEVDKHLYVYLTDCYRFFVEKNEGDMFPSQASIADACGLEIKSVGRAIRNFINHGVITAVKGKPDKGGRERWFYKHIVPELSVWKGKASEPKPVVFEAEDSQPYKKPQPKPPQPSYQPVRTNPVPRVLYDPEDDSDSPF